MKLENMNKNNRGITLIALIVTVIILIIIAGMSISSLIGKNSIFKQTDSARVTQIEGTVREQVKLGCSLMQMDIEEERIYDRDYSAKSDAENIKNSLENTLNSDKEGLSGQFKTEVSDSTITIIYVGNDYKNACNDDNAEIKFTVKLEDVSIEIAGEENSTLKDDEGNDAIIDIGATKPGLYKAGTNYQELDKSWEELIEDGVIHVNDGVVTTNYTVLDADTGEVANSSSSVLNGDLLLPDNIIIGEFAFDSCIGLKGIKIPYGIQKIDKAAFQHCSDLTSVEIPNSVTSMGTYVFASCSSLINVKISNNITTIPQQTFYNCTSLKSIKIPKNIKEISYAAFVSCTNLTEVIIEEGLKTIGQSAFNKCTNLKSMQIPNGVTTIGPYAFQDTGITSIGTVGSDALLKIPDSVTSFGKGAFYRCTSLTNVELSDSITNIEEGLFAKCTNLVDIEIPNSVTSIAIYAFQETGITGIGPVGSGKSLEIPDSVISIADQAFRGCTALTTVELTDNMAGIPIGLFAYCTSLKEVTIPKTVTNIDLLAFGGCTNLTSIKFDGTKEQWNSIQFGEYWNESTGNYIIYCTDGNIEK